MLYTPSAEEGRAAFLAGKTQLDNPHPADTPEREGWLAGFSEAYREKWNRLDAIMEALGLEMRPVIERPVRRRSW